jgi:hypothetical protein
MEMNIMSLNKIVLVSFFAMSTIVYAAERTACPASLKEKTGALVGARLFDGNPSEQVELVPDNENGATWDISGYKNSGHDIYLVCDYKNGESKNMVASKSSLRCYVKGKKRVAAWCGK